MTHTSTAAPHSVHPAERRPGRIRALLAAFDRYTLRTMNVPAELGGRPARTDRPTADTRS